MSTYKNPVLKGFYPDPSVCFANGKFYMVCSSFQYFPGVPLFESDDLVNWTQIGHVLTRRNQVDLDKINSSGGIFAPTIRYNNGRFYMVTTNDTTHRNFYVFTDDIYGEWSDPVLVERDGIDPSLYFEGGRTYFLSNGSDDFGDGGVVQVEIDIETGRKLSPARCIWHGSGGRYLESPHMYKIGDYYYLMAAEGGTEYGHMITYARSKDIWGPFENYPHNPVLTNRNKAPSIIQGIGHGDLICDKSGNWHILSLGFRQLDIWYPYHTCGREVFLTPVEFHEDGWFTASDGYTHAEYENKADTVQAVKNTYTFENCPWELDWCYLRHPDCGNYELGEGYCVLKGSDVTIDMADSPTFIGIRQKDIVFEAAVDITLTDGEGGFTAYMSESEHYDIALRSTDKGVEAILKLNIGSIKHIERAVPISGNKARLIITADPYNYRFFVETDGERYGLGYGGTKYLSSEVAGGFTGVLLGLYAIGGSARFEGFRCEYE